MFIKVVLPGARVADDADELAFVERQIDVLENLARAEAFADVAQFEEAHASNAPVRFSATNISRSSAKPTTPMVMIERMMCS